MRLHNDAPPGVQKDALQCLVLFGQDSIARLGQKIRPMMSECLVTGFLQSDGSVILAVPDKQVSNGLRLS